VGYYHSSASPTFAAKPFGGTKNMTTQDIIIWTCAYLIELGAVIYFTRASARRTEGALVGGAAAGLLGMGAVALGEARAWWHIPFASTLSFLPLFYIGLSISLTPIYLVTWRLTRRFGWRGLAVFIGIVAVIGPPRDYLIAATFPKWMVFAPGVIPILADAATYVGMVAVGHATMRFIAGPASEDKFARTRIEAA
jgi:hypothetical protein